MKKSLKIFLIILSIVTTLFVFGFTNVQEVYSAQSMSTSEYPSIPDGSSIVIAGHNDTPEELERKAIAKVNIGIILAIFFIEIIAFIIIKIINKEKTKNKSETEK